MRLLSLFRKNKQEPASTGAYQTRAEDESDSVRRGRARRSSAKERNKANDPVLPEKKRARRRLVGAVALVLAAVIGLPMILDSEPRPVADDIAIDIPSKDKREKGGQVPPQSGSQGAQPQAAPPVAAAKPAPASALDKDEEVIDPASLPAPGEVAPSTASRSEMPQLVKPEPKAETKSTKTESKADKRSDASRAPKPEAGEHKSELAHAKPESKPAHGDRGDELARANAILEGKPEPKQEARHEPEKKSGGNRFVLQVAALATQDKVDELQEKLKSAGIASYTQKIATGSGSRTRVRVGPFSSKEEADRVRAKLGKLGLNGTLVPT
jgi:DedD protein